MVLPGPNPGPARDQLQLEIERRPRGQLFEDRSERVRVQRREALDEGGAHADLLPVVPLCSRGQRGQQLQDHRQGLLGAPHAIEEDSSRAPRNGLPRMELEPRVQQADPSAQVQAQLGQAPEEALDVLRSLPERVRREVQQRRHEVLGQLVLALLQALDEGVRAHVGGHPGPGAPQRGRARLEGQQLEDGRQRVEPAGALEQLEGLLLLHQGLPRPALDAGDHGGVVGARRGILQDAPHQVLVEGEGALRVEPVRDRVEGRLGLEGPAPLVHGEAQPLAPHAEGSVLVPQPARRAEQGPQPRQVLRRAAAVLHAEEELAHAVGIAGGDQGQERAQGLLDAHRLARDEPAAADRRAQARQPRGVGEAEPLQEPVRGGLVAGGHPGAQDLLDRVVVVGERLREPTVGLQRSLDALAGEGQPAHDLAAAHEAGVLLQAVGRGRALTLGRADSRRTLAQDLAELGLELLRVPGGAPLELRRGAGGQQTLEGAGAPAIPVVGVARAPPQERVVGLVLLGAPRDRQRAPREQELQRAAVEVRGLGVGAQGLLQLPHLDQQPLVGGRGGQQGAVGVEREPGLLGGLEEPRGVPLEALVVRHVAGQREGPTRGVGIPGVEEGLAEVQVDLRRDQLPARDQAPAEGEEQLGIPLPAAAAEAVPLAAGQVHELAQDRGHARTGDRQGGLVDADHPAPVLLLLVEVGEQLVEVGLVVPEGEACEGRPPGPGDRSRVGAAVRELVQDAVDGDREQVVAVGMGGQALEHAQRQPLLAGLLEQVAHQQVGVDAARVCRDPTAVHLQGLVPHPRQRQDTGLELGGDRVGLELAQAREHRARLLGLPALHHAHRELAQVLGLALGVQLDQALDRLLVGEVVVGGEVDARLLLEGLTLAPARVAEELVDDLGGGDRVPHLGVQAHQEGALLLVGLPREHGLLELDGQVREGPQA